MSKRQIIALCICNIVIYSGISGLVGLMPIYLEQLGADATVTGFFLAFVYLSLALSNITGGWLSGWLQRRKTLLILGGLLAVPIAWLMSQTSAVGPLLLLMVGLWFTTGISMTMVTILTGLSSEATHRGRNFGLLSLSTGLGLFLGGWISGPIVDRWGFPALFAAFAAFYLLLPAAGWFVEDRGGGQPERKAAVSGFHGIFSERTFTILFAASILAQAANIMIFLSRPLIMNALDFDLSTISRTAAIGSLVTLPLPLILGWLTDRIGRKPIIVACFLAPTLGLLVQVTAVHLWQFWVSSILYTVVGASIVVGSALVSDIFVEEARSVPLALLNATPWIGIVAGLSAGGIAMNVFQIRPALLLAMLPGIVAILLLGWIKERT